MDELLQMMHTLMEKVDRMENSIEELKSQQRPLSSRDYIHSLKNEKAVELDEWLQNIKITKANICKMLEEKSYQIILATLKLEQSLRIFNNNKNTVFCFVDGKWKTMTKQNIEKMQTILFNKIHKEFTAMKKENDSSLNEESIKELSYIEQRGVINMITHTTHTKFKSEVYAMLKEPK